MKTFFSIVGVILLLCIYGIYSTTPKSELLEGYIPPNMNPEITWEKTSDDRYEKKHQVPVILQAGDTVLADIPESFGGGYLVKFKNSYPPSIGKTVYVNIIFYPEKNIYVVADANLKKTLKTNQREIKKWKQ